MPSERDYAAEHERALEVAQERGFYDRAEQTEWRNFAREMGADSRDEITLYSQVFHDFEPGHYDDNGEWVTGSMDVDDFRDIYMELHDIEAWDDMYDDDFYEWLREFYDNT